MASKTNKKSVTGAASSKLQSASNLPTAIRFPLAVLINLSLAAVLYTIAGPFIGEGLAVAAPKDTEWSLVGLLISCRVFELAVSWWCNFDSYDIAALSVLSRFPREFLLGSFYYVGPSTVLTCLAIDVASTFVPFSLLRPTLPSHKPNAPKGTIANRTILTDLPTQILVSALAASGFALVYAAFCWTRLPLWLAMNFEGIPTITAAYEAQYILLLLTFIPIGVATKVFLFTPSIGARPDKKDAERLEFDPVTASLGQTILYNAWGFSVRERVLIERTFILSTAILVNTVIEVYSLVAGSTLTGAFVWSGIWTFGSILSGAMLLWVGSVDEVQN